MVIAAIAGIAVAVIATLTMINAPVAAAFGAAHQVTAVPHHPITIVTGLDAGLHNIVAARSDGAAVEAGISVDSIAVVTGLVALRSRVEVAPPHTVTAGRRLTAIGASIGRVAVAIITGFALVQTVVAAHFAAALAIAAITGIGVAIIASFTVVETVVAAGLAAAIRVAAVTRHSIAVVAGFTALLHHIVATGGDGAGVQAGIGVDPVTIVAALIPLRTGRQIVAHDSVAAARRYTGVGAGILIKQIAIVASLLPLKAMPIAATRQGTIAQAGVSLQLVAIIAGLAEIAPPVAAGFDLAGAIATIARVGVAVIAAFVAVESAVAAAFEPALRVAAVAGCAIAVVTALGSDMTDAVAAACGATAAGTGVGIDGIAVVAGFAGIDAPVAADIG